MAATKRKSDHFEERPDHDDDHGADGDQPKQNHIPRPPNAWILYRKHMAAMLRQQRLDTPGERPLPQSMASKEIAERWRKESYEVKSQFERLAEIEKHKHAMQYPDYRFQPQSKEQRERQKQLEKEAKQREREAARKAAKKRRTNPPTNPQPQALYHTLAYPATAGASTSGMQLQLPPTSSMLSAPSAMPSGVSFVIPTLQPPEDPYGPYGSTPPLAAAELFNEASPTPSSSSESSRQSVPPVETRQSSAEPSSVSAPSPVIADPGAVEVQKIVEVLQAQQTVESKVPEQWSLPPVNPPTVTYHVPAPAVPDVNAWSLQDGNMVFNAADATMFATDAPGVFQVENFPENLLTNPLPGSLDFSQGQLPPLEMPEMQALLGHFDFNFDFGLPHDTMPFGSGSFLNGTTFDGNGQGNQDLVSQFMNFEGFDANAFTPSSSGSATSPGYTIAGTPATDPMSVADHSHGGYVPPAGAVHTNVRRVAASWPPSFAIGDDDDLGDVHPPTHAVQYRIPT
ncbi:hypothetical protein PUNSTDRAFT_142151 [Punctularia strigosozonata HHB-11173 SS5]|uniref:uncharacterized protein n=1 Tax=Punctularia strigosozonata (strain HHB-11173) TaxID=741275 RepID=UPI00044178E8|nr:uncharacterized protein PUNSTDRAFT_142151 [Punctularia strigosozonata HHB-11173 SS5]EIN11947.1 hypothetical protein PUNSTDRAFT_142151 [Punctularia strigosozonata HHB-11173 SS5]